MTLQHTLEVGAARLELHQGDISRIRVDAVVNAANERLAPGAGVCGALHRAAGPTLAEECEAVCQRTGGCPTGQAVLTGAGRLPARHVIHTVGPIWRQGTQKEALLLASCYRECLALARERRVRSIAFPALSTGIFGYPLKQAARVALVTTAEELAQHGKPSRILHVLFDEEALDTFAVVLRELALSQEA